MYKMYYPIDKELMGFVCKKARQIKHYTQYEVSCEIGVTQSAISKFESGKRFSSQILWWYMTNCPTIIKDYMYEMY